MLRLACLSAGVASALAMMAGHVMKGALLAATVIVFVVWLARR